MATKRELEIEVATLKAKLAAVPNTIAAFSGREWNVREFIPCGKIEPVRSSSFCDDIRDAVSEQYDGRTGWIVVSMNVRRPFPFDFILVEVDYTTADGTICGAFCPLAAMKGEQ